MQMPYIKVKGRAYNRADKEKIVKELLDYWSLPGNKEMRLGQLIVNAIGMEKIFYIEDENLISIIKDFTKAKEKGN